MITAHITLTRQ